MQARYCQACERRTGHKRAIGAGTLIMLFITWGAWLLALPFYPKRCVVCGLQNGARSAPPRNQ